MSHYRKIYEDYIQSPAWKEKRAQALERDAHRCRVCNSSEKLEVHHRTYARLGHEDLNDLTTLCESCHEHFHKKMMRDEMMTRTYSAPRTGQEIPPAERERMNGQKWEDFLIGLLLLDRDLVSYVHVILSKEDFSGEETCALFEVLHSSLLIPPELMPAVTRCHDAAKNEFSSGKAANVKLAMQSATRVKSRKLLSMNEELNDLIRNAGVSNDRVEVRRLQVQQLDLCQKLRTLNSTKALH